MATDNQITMNEESSTLKINKRSVNITFINILIFILLLKFLPHGAKENAGLAMLVLVAIFWLTEAIHVTFTALLVPFLAVALQLTSVKEALSSFADPIIFLFFGGFALATALHIQGLDKLLANRLIVLAKGRFGVAVFMLFSVTAWLSMWISNTATTAMMLPLVLGILSKLDVSKERKNLRICSVRDCLQCKHWWIRYDCR